ncbi:hypothetical protein AGOR_G00045780 [Albula goreensis]|uniref:Myosin tail domain-containing protein n=1 Tax=Albula goreensis TaxID=1534307 RepID=A0A8T3DX89_9TELE|nr:hypothetical protein AGOR_G00045780 [Albula goreensis]
MKRRCPEQVVETKDIFNNLEKTQSLLMEDTGTTSTSISVMSEIESGQTDEQSQVPTIKLTPPSEDPPLSNPSDCKEATSSASERSEDGGISAELPSESGERGSSVESDVDPKKDPETSISEEAPSSPQIKANPKYALSLGTSIIGNSSRGSENGGQDGRISKCGSLESLVSQDWDTMSDRMSGTESPPRVFNSPYSSLSNDFKGRVSPVTSEISLFSLNSRSASPVSSPTLLSPRGSYTVYKTLTRRHEVGPSGLTLRSGSHSKRDYIKELTLQLEESQKRNKFLEAESKQLDKERNQLRFEMRSLLVRNEDLLQNNTQLQGEMRMMMEKIEWLEGERSHMSAHIRQLEKESAEAKEMMAEAKTQESAFGYLQKSLKSKIQDAEETLEKHTKDSQSMSEKLWQAERKLVELCADKQTQEKKTAELEKAMLHLQAELAMALQSSNETMAELVLQRGLRNEAQLKVKELEHNLTEKTEELQRAQQTVTRLQGEVSEKRSDKEWALEKQIQLREQAELQCKQAERTAKDTQAELQTLNLLKEELAKQLKQAKDQIMDLENNMEDIHDSEQRWADKHKKAVTQVEELRKNLMKEKDLNDQLDSEKGRLEREIRVLRIEVQELKDCRIQNDMLAKTELKVKELEDTLQTESRNKAALVNTIGKLERKVKQLTDQLEEEHEANTQETTQMTQRIRSLRRQLNEAQEEASHKETQKRQTQRELQEERENTARLQRQLMERPLQIKQDSLMARHSLPSQKRMVSC